MKNFGAYAVILLFALSWSSAHEVVQDEDGQEFYLVPFYNRQRRQTTTWNLETTNPGVRATVGHSGTILERNGHSLEGGASVSKQFFPTGPTTVGGNVGYKHVPSGSGVNVGAQHTPGFGTDLGVNAVGNIWRSGNGNTRLDAVGSYGRHYGGPWGNSRPNAYGGLQFTHNFP